MASRADVARLAGVAESTVSYALNGSRPVAEATRGRIERAMRQLGYVPHPLARGLAHGRTGLVAIQVPLEPGGVVLLEVEYLDGAMQAAEAAGYQLLVWTPVAGSNLAGPLERRLAEGVLLLDVRLDDPRLALLRRSGTPFVLIGRTARTEGLDFVDADYDAMATAAIEHLARLGHRTVLLLTPLDVDSGAPRAYTAWTESAVRAVAPRFDVVVEVRRAPATVDGGWAALAGALDAPDPPTAVLAIDERTVWGAMGAARERGLRIPEDLSVVVFGLSDLVASSMVPGLTNVRASGGEIARRGMEALVRRIASPESDPVQMLVAPTLTPRGSSGPAPFRR